MHSRKASTPKKPEPRRGNESQKPRTKRTDRLNNEKKMREAILIDVQRNHWNRQGIRRLSRLARLPHRTARDTLARMEEDAQIKVDTKWGQGRRYGVKVLLSHPAWSGHKTAQLAPVLAGEKVKTHRPFPKGLPREEQTRTVGQRPSSESGDVGLYADIRAGQGTGGNPSLMAANFSRQNETVRFYPLSRDDVSTFITRKTLASTTRRSPSRV